MKNNTLFSHILTNTAIAGFTNMLLWFAITFWAYLETQSVFVTGVLGGVYLVLNLLGGIWFGSFVDHHPKRYVMMVSSFVSLGFYAVGFSMLALLPSDTWSDVKGVWLWIFILMSMLGVAAGNIRMIALSTLVTLLIPEWERDRANGKIWAVNGLVFTVVSAFSWVLIGQLGMIWAVGIAVIVTLAIIIHLYTLHFPPEAHLDEQHEDDKKIDLRGTIRIILSIPGLFAMIFFAMFNNFIGGVFMALMDAYGLSLVSVEIWWVVLAVTSIGFIIGGALVSRYGLGKNPVKTLLILSLIAWCISIFFTTISSIVITAIGFFLWMIVWPIAEACEQTIMQKVVPLERQWRVFGFGQSLENIASPFTAFLIGPLTQFIVMPWLAGPMGSQIFAGWWGTTPDRAMALVFVVAGLIGLIVTLIAFTTRSYRDLSKSYREG